MRLMLMRQLVKLGVLALAMTAMNAYADRARVDETRDAKADGFVKITIVRGDIKIGGWDRNQIQVRGELDEQTEEFIFEVKGDDAFIEVKLPRSINSWCCEEGSKLDIKVPHGTHLDVSVVSTDVTVDDIKGGVEVGSVSGDVRATNVADRVDITTVSGDVDVRDARGRIELKSVSGDVEGNDLAGDLRLSSVSGDVVIRDVSDEMNLESVSGDIEVISASFSTLTGHTVSGDVDIVGEFKPGGTLEFDSVSGSVRVRFKGQVDARFDVETGSGSIRNRITADRPAASKYARDETLRFVAGEGKGEVIIGTRSGDIVLSRD